MVYTSIDCFPLHPKTENNQPNNKNRCKCSEPLQDLYALQPVLPVGVSESLLEMDQRLVECFLDGDCLEETHKPSNKEIKVYEESIIYRIKVLRRAKIQCFLLFQDLYIDVKNYKYAWFCIIFKRKEYLMYSQQAIQVLKSLADIQFKKKDFQGGTKSLTIFGHAFQCFKNTVSEAHAVDYYKSIPELIHCHHDLLFTASKCHALTGNKDDAIDLFGKALRIEEFIRACKHQPCQDLVQGTVGCHVTEEGFVLVCREQIWKCLINAHQRNMEKEKR